MMDQKQEYTIPENVNGDFEIMQHVTLKDSLCFIPALLLIIPIILMPISIYIKVPFVTIIVIISCVFVYVRPVRENIPFWRHANELIHYYYRQRLYYYRKEEIHEKQEEEWGAEEAAATTNERATFHTSKGS